MQIHFLSDVLICCHQEILLPWQCDVTTSPLYSLSDDISVTLKLKIHVTHFGDVSSIVTSKFDICVKQKLKITSQQSKSIWQVCSRNEKKCKIKIQRKFSQND